MNESWTQFVVAGLLGYIVYELRQIRHELSGRIQVGECNRRMRELGEEVAGQGQTLVNHESRISKLER